MKLNKKIQGAAFAAPFLFPQSRINQPQENRTIRWIDDDVRGVDVRGIRHGRPIGADAAAQIIRLDLQPPTEVILGP